MISKTVCELFAGVGGFRLGLEKASADWQTVWANQWEPGKKVQHAFECYESHFGHSVNHINDDISKINKVSVPNHNLLVGGFPCQDYSVARTGAKGITGVKGVLWWQIRDILESKSPRFVLLENVDRLLKSPTNQRGRDFSVILKCFDDLGYNVEWRVINAAEYGFPQRRRRVFIFASKDNSNFSKEYSLFSTESILLSEGFFAQTFPISNLDRIKETDLRIFPDVYDISESLSFSYQNSGLMHNGKVFTCHTKPIDIEPNNLLNLVETNVDSKYYLNGSLDKWAYLKGPKRLNRKSKNGFEYTFSEGGMSFPDSLNKPTSFA